jgi:phosphatidylserine/phosphatidylglycerophosphate/cardiolipin synthase-like enzyme
MTIKLIYHSLDSGAGGISPFDDAVMEVAEGDGLCIACPYLGLTYLWWIIEAASGWRLLTDVDAWLCSNTHEKIGIEQFIVDHADCVRHCRSLHAKVLIGGGQALIGSANFTDSGIGRNLEMSVQFDDCEQVLKLRDWFDGLWLQTRPISMDDLRSSVASVQETPPSSGYIPLPCEVPSIGSRLRPLHFTGSDNAQVSHSMPDDIMRKQEEWRKRKKDRGPQQLWMLAIYTALEKTSSRLYR